MKYRFAICWVPGRWCLRLELSVGQTNASSPKHTRHVGQSFMAATLNQEKKHSRSLILRELLIRDDQCLAVTFVARRKGYVLEVDESLAQRSI